jgi:hypothetical protein
MDQSVVYIGITSQRPCAMGGNVTSNCLTTYNPIQLCFIGWMPCHVACAWRTKSKVITGKVNVLCWRNA